MVDSLKDSLEFPSYRQSLASQQRLSWVRPGDEGQRGWNSQFKAQVPCQNGLPQLKAVPTTIPFTRWRPAEDKVCAPFWWQRRGKFLGRWSTLQFHFLLLSPIWALLQVLGLLYSSHTSPLLPPQGPGYGCAVCLEHCFLRPHTHFLRLCSNITP